MFKLLIFSHTDLNVWNNLFLRHYLPPCVDSWGCVVGFPSLKSGIFHRIFSKGIKTQDPLSQLGSKSSEFGNFLIKNICMRVFIESAKDIFANWWKGYVNCYGTGYFKGYEILSHISVKEKVRQAHWPELCGSDSLQSGTWCSGSKGETKIQLTEPPCSPVVLGTKGVGKVSSSSAEPKCTGVWRKCNITSGCLSCCGKSEFKELCAKLFNHLIRLSLTWDNWLCDTSLTQLWVIPFQSWPQLAEYFQSIFFHFLFLFSLLFYYVSFFQFP